jgi:hypothetical protein
MSAPTAGRTHLVLVGATGMVGGYALRYALERPDVERVTAIGRRTLGISHRKLKEIIHPNFGDCSAIAESLSHQDAAIFCLGAYTGAVSDAEFRTITVDYAVEFARVLHTSSPSAEFVFLGGRGADPTGKNRIAFARYKGEAENALLAAGFHAVSTSFAPPTSIPCSGGKSRISATDSCARSIPYFRCVSQPSDPGRRFGTGDGRRRRATHKGAPRIGAREQRYPRHGRAPAHFQLHNSLFLIAHFHNVIIGGGVRLDGGLQLLVTESHESANAVKNVAGIAASIQGGTLS